MATINEGISRRRLLQWLAVGMVAGPLPSAVAEPLTRPIPAGGERLPLIGMGTWLTFDVGEDAILRGRRCEVLRTFLELGGGMVDSSPMYGSAEAVLGHCLERQENYDGLFSATKVWTPGQRFGINQMEHSRRLWGLPRFDLMQIHNMLDWETHLETLKAMKAEGAIRYIGITTSHGRRHGELERVLAQEEAFDFVQFTYNLVDREVERRLLPLAAERGIAVIINRPFRGGALFSRVRGRALPGWAAEFDCHNWAQFFLKFIVSHPAVTCAIPATTQVEHMRENMGAARGELPTPQLRRRMQYYFASL
ncbi:MAG: aldo/keto reductase [Gammaproteobacteria bacterium]|nr:aldo/keto reductase [Gammaproteobacteria bacterium]MCW8957898.1 aldo/keto reductase [Gammaproteobacteria bacterium]MCW8973835.1 aldo/keto reductase [Gammaproteobacteria bacterium]MCW8992763.1 aldo/keto reductase [Gammaproteobacteria bacterium]